MSAEISPRKLARQPKFQQGVEIQREEARFVRQRRDLEVCGLKRELIDGSILIKHAWSSGPNFFRVDRETKSATASLPNTSYISLAADWMFGNASMAAGVLFPISLVRNWHINSRLKVTQSGNPDCTERPVPTKMFRRR